MSRILIIEDEKNLARFVELELKHEGYETNVQFNGRTGLEAALSQDFDVILLDLMLPELTGSKWPGACVKSRVRRSL
jgi:Response regulators consisting of a CheY-like receiver domain and a winged-helix DNA-binding domain